MKSFVKILQTKTFIENKEKRLFCSVIYQAIEDADYKGLDKKYLKYKKEAIDWLLNMSDDFCLIVDLAGYNPEYIKDKIKNLTYVGKYQFTQEQFDILYHTGINKKIIKLNDKP